MIIKFIIGLILICLGTIILLVPLTSLFLKLADWFEKILDI